MRHLIHLLAIICLLGLGFAEAVETVAVAPAGEEAPTHEHHRHHEHAAVDGLELDAGHPVGEAADDHCVQCCHLCICVLLIDLAHSAAQPAQTTLIQAVLSPWLHHATPPLLRPPIA